MFGFGEDDNVQQPQEKSFFGSIFSFLGSVLKWAAIAVAAVVTLGFVFNNNTARDFADKLPGLNGKGLGTTIMGLKDTIIDKVTGFFGSTNLSSEPPAHIEQVKNSNVLVAESFFKNAGPIKNPEEYRKLGDLKAAQAFIYSDATTIPSERPEAIQNFAKLQQNSLNLGAAFDKWDKLARDTIEKNKDANAPVPPIFDLSTKLVPLSSELEEYGAKKVGKSWDSLSRIEKIANLSTISSGEVTNPANFKKRSLNTDSFLMDNIIESAHAEGTPKMGISNILVSSLAPINDKAKEADTKDKLSEMVSQGNYKEALDLSKKTESYFKQRIEDMKTWQANSVKENHTKYDEKPVLHYREVTKDFGELNTKIEALMLKDKVDSVLSKDNIAINETATTVPARLKQYEEKVEVYKSQAAAQKSEDQVASNKPSTKQEDLKLALLNGATATTDDNKIGSPHTPSGKTNTPGQQTGISA